MQTSIWISLLVFTLIALGVLTVVAILMRRYSAALDPANQGKHPKGYWMSVGISIGVAIGVALGPIFDNLGVGIGIGVALGTAIGTSLEQRNKDNLRPLTEQEKTRQKRSISIGLAAAAILAVLLIIIYFLQTR